MVLKSVKARSKCFDLRCQAPPTRAAHPWAAPRLQRLDSVDCMKSTKARFRCWAKRPGPLHPSPPLAQARECSAQGSNSKGEEWMVSVTVEHFFTPIKALDFSMCSRKVTAIQRLWTRPLDWLLVFKEFAQSTCVSPRWTQLCFLVRHRCLMGIHCLRP